MLTKDFVRIRLALGRTDKPPYESGTFIATYQNRHIGFSEEDITGQFRDSAFSVAKNGEIKVDMITLERKPIPGYQVVDFVSSYKGKKPIGEVHYGDNVVTEGKLPDGIYKSDLITLAEMYIGQDTLTLLTRAKSSESQLALAIKNRIDGILYDVDDTVVENEIGMNTNKKKGGCQIL